MKKFIAFILTIIMCISPVLTAFATQADKRILGDVDMDGYVAIVDAAYIQYYCVDLKTFTGDQERNADVDGDGEITIIDATYIQYYLVHLIDKFPAEATDDEVETQPTDESTQETVEPTKIETEPTQTESITEPTDSHTEPTEPETEPTQTDTATETETRPTKVENVAYEVSGTSATLSWDNIDSCTKYWVYKYNSSTGTWYIAATTTDNTAKVSNLSKGVLYTFKVIGCFSSTSVMLLSNADPIDIIIEDTATESTENATEPTTETSTPTQVETVNPLKVENFIGTASDNNITFTWDGINGAQKYWVYMYDEDVAVWKAVGSTTENTVEVKELGYDKIYRFKVIAKLADNSVMLLPNADEISVTTEQYDGDKPIKIENITYEIADTTITFSWDAVDGCARYWVYKLSDSGKWESAVSTSDTTAQAIRLSECTTYKFKIIGVFSDNSSMSDYDADTLIITTIPTPTEPPTIDPCIEYSQKLLAMQGENTLTLSVMADVHYDEKDLYNQKKAEVIRHLGELQDMVDIDLTCVLGDVVIGNVDKQTTLTSLDALLSLYEENLKTPMLTVRGNHDDNGWYTFEYEGTNQQDEIINDEEWWNIVSKNLPDGFVTDENKPYGGYGYYDHEDTKIRIFMLNSSDIPYILKEDGSYRYNSYQGACFSNEQLNFVAQSLKFDDKQNPNEWAALFLMHIPMDTSNAEGERFGGVHALIRGGDYMLSIIEAYRKGTAFSRSGSTYNNMLVGDREEDFMVDVNVDYSDKGTGEVISFVSGHTHMDNYCDEVGSKNSLSYGYSYIGVIGSTSFATIVIDRDNSTVSLLKFGDIIPASEKDGVVISDTDTGSVESGQWSVKYNTALPDNDLFNGLSDIYPMHYTFDDINGIDLQTLELLSAKETKASRVLTKAVAVKPYTTYILPADYNGTCMTATKTGYKQTYLDAVDHGEYKTITTLARSSYLVFSLDAGYYKDYENFYIKELYSGIEY